MSMSYLPSRTRQNLLAISYVGYAQKTYQLPSFSTISKNSKELRLSSLPSRTRQKPVAITYLGNAQKTFTLTIS